MVCPCRPLAARCLLCRYLCLTLPSVLIFFTIMGNVPGPATKVSDYGLLSAIHNGTASQTGSSPPARVAVVPKLVHLIWFYPPNTDLRFHHLLCIMSIKQHIKPIRIVLWYDHEPTGPWWAFAKKVVPDIFLMKYEPPTTVFNQTVATVEHQSDVARLDILLQYGGIYLDLDVIALRSVDSLLHYDVTLGAETPDLLGSGVIFARPNASFIRLLRQEYRTFDDRRWNYHSVILPMKLARSYPDVVHVEWFSILRPNWFERDWLFRQDKLWDWSENYLIHLWYRTHDSDYDPHSIKSLNNTLGEVFRYIYYGS